MTFFIFKHIVREKYIEFRIQNRTYYVLQSISRICLLFPLDMTLSICKILAIIYINLLYTYTRKFINRKIEEKGHSLYHVSWKREFSSYALDDRITSSVRQRDVTKKRGSRSYIRILYLKRMLRCIIGIYILILILILLVINSSLDSFF